MESCSFFQEGKVFAEKLKQQPVIEFWDKQALMGCLLLAARWAVCYQAT